MGFSGGMTLLPVSLPHRRRRARSGPRRAGGLDGGFAAARDNDRYAVIVKGRRGGFAGSVLSRRDRRGREETRRERLTLPRARTYRGARRFFRREIEIWRIPRHRRRP